MINGGIDTIEDALTHMDAMSGVMLGRAAYHNPMILGQVDAAFFGESREAPTLATIMAEMADYAEAELSSGARLNQITRHMLGLANGLPGARQFRQIMSVDACRPGAGPEILFKALATVEPQDMAKAG